MSYPKLLRDVFENDGAGPKFRADKVPVDTALSATSTNAVQNKIVKAQLDTKLPLAGGNITGSLSIGNVEVVPVANNAAAHNAIYRGIDLTTKYTEAQISAKIQAGDFSDLFIGDYIPKTLTIDNTTVTSNWTFAHFDYWYGIGDNDMTSHHVVLVPHTNLYNAQINSTDTTVGAFIGSSMYTTELPKVASALENAFGSTHVLSFRNLISQSMNSSLNSMAGGGLTGAVPFNSWKWVTQKCSLMSEPMVYGTIVCASSAFEVACCKSRLALFTLNPSAMNARLRYWLSSLAGSSLWAFVSGNGLADSTSPSLRVGVRPFFLYH